MLHEVFLLRLIITSELSEYSNTTDFLRLEIVYANYNVYKHTSKPH